MEAGHGREACRCGRLQLTVADEHDDEPWTSDHLFLMAQAADTDVAAFLLLAKAAHPNELRALAQVSGVENIEQLRELTIQVTVAVRSMTTAAEMHLRSWVAARHERMNGNKRSSNHT